MSVLRRCAEQVCFRSDVTFQSHDHFFADRIDPDRPLEPWLYRVTANLACTWVKRRRWLRPIEDLAEWLIGENKNSPAQAAEEAEQWQEVKQALAALPLTHRTVIVLHYINDLSVQEIAEVLDLPVGTVKSRLHYARKALKKIMSQQGGLVPEVQYEFT